MSRFDDALAAIEQSLADLKDAYEGAKAQQEAKAHEATMANKEAMVDEHELRAMKAELGEAVRLLEAMQQQAPSQPLEQTDEAVS